MSGKDDGVQFSSPEEFAAAVNGLIQKREQAVQKAAKATGSAGEDTTVNRADRIPGRGKAEASFAYVTYVPAPIYQLRRTTNPDGSITTIEIIDSTVVGWTAGGSVSPEDNVSRALGATAFSGGITGWPSQYA